MTFGAPMFLVVAALLVPVLVAFLVKQRRRVLVVPSTMVWRMGARSVARNRRFKDLRRWIALVSCLVAIGVLALAAARPTLGKGSDAHVFVVDVSASMSGRPIELARAWLAREVASLGPHARVAVVLAGNDASVLVPPSIPGPAVEEAIRSIAATPSGAAMESAMTVAQGLASGLGARVVVLSDAPVDVDAERFPNKPHQRVLARGSRPGQGDDNVGISGLHTRARADRTRDDEREVTVAVATSSAKARRVRLSMRQEGNVLADREVTIPPRGESTERVTVRSGGKIFAEVSALDGTADAVSLDDRASLEQPIVSPPRVALVSPIATTSEDATSTFFVEHAVRASGVAELVRVDPQGESLPDAGSVAFDVAVVVVDGPGRPRDVPSFYVGAPPAQLTNVHVATRETARLRSVANDDALIRGVALDEVTFLRANVATPSPGSRVIVDLDAGPTLIAGGSGAQSWVWLGIEPQASDLVLRVAFPVLIGNVLAHLSGGAQTLAAQTVPRSEITFTAREVSVPLADAPEPRWRLPTSLPMVLAMVAALLLAFEAWWTFRSASRAP